MSWKALSLVMCSAVNAYLLGVMVLFGAVLYPQFPDLDRTAFPAFYAAFNSRIGAPVVLFEFLALITTLLLYAARPDDVPAVAVHVLVTLGVVYFGITFGWHLPSHRVLAGGDNSAGAMAPLLASQWARTAVQVVRCAGLAWLSILSMAR